jgi:hypothetical protein
MWRSGFQPQSARRPNVTVAFQPDESGYIEGQNVATESVGDNQFDRPLALVADLVRRRGGDRSHRRYRSAGGEGTTTTIPSSGTGVDPVELNWCQPLSVWRERHCGIANLAANGVGKLQCSALDTCAAVRVLLTRPFRLP